MKRKILLTIVACGASLALTPGLYAQDSSPSPSGGAANAASEGGHHHGGESIEMLTKQLDLTADEQTQIKPILETLHNTVKTTREDTSLEPKDKMQKIRDARETANTQIRALLTADQQTKFDAMLANMRNHHGHGGSSATGAPAATGTN